MSDRDLKQRVQGILAERDRLQPPPAFAASWQAACRAAEARRPTLAVRAVSLWPAVAAAAIAAIAIAATLQFLGGRDETTPGSEAEDLRLARELAPARQWPTATDALLRHYDYAPPPGIEMPAIENPFEESYL